MVTFKVLPLGSYTPMPAPTPPFEAILKLFLAAEDSSSDDENLDESILQNLKEKFF